MVNSCKFKSNNRNFYWKTYGLTVQQQIYILIGALSVLLLCSIAVTVYILHIVSWWVSSRDHRISPFHCRLKSSIRKRALISRLNRQVSFAFGKSQCELSKTGKEIFKHLEIEVLKGQENGQPIRKNWISLVKCCISWVVWIFVISNVILVMCVMHYFTSYYISDIQCIDIVPNALMYIMY